MLAVTTTLGFQWTDGEGNAYSPSPAKMQCPYISSLSGSIQVPAGAKAGSEVDITFEGLPGPATFIRIKNISGQELGMAWQGNFMPNIPDGGVIIWSHPVAVKSGGINSLRFFLTQDQIVAGSVQYTVAG